MSNLASGIFGKATDGEGKTEMQRVTIWVKSKPREEKRTNQGKKA